MFIEIETANAAFIEDEGELNRILNTVTGQSGQKLRDVNGNMVGSVQSVNDAEIGLSLALRKIKTLISDKEYKNSFSWFERKYNISTER